MMRKITLVAVILQILGTCTECKLSTPDKLKRNAMDAFEKLTRNTVDAFERVSSNALGDYTVGAFALPKRHTIDGVRKTKKNTIDDDYDEYQACDVGMTVLGECDTVSKATSDSDYDDDKKKANLNRKKFQPNWESLDERELPKWYDDAKFGIFVHWGVYSVPAFGSEWFWKYWEGDRKSEYNEYMKDNYPTHSYQDFAPELTGKNFDADRLAKLVIDSGAKYFVFTSKHHEGFTHWKSEESWNWNSVDMGPKRDIVSELKTAFEDTNVTFGLYFSLYEWFNPWYMRDKDNEFRTSEYVQRKIKHQLKDLILRYEPLYIWSDGDWEAKSTYWNSTHFLAWLYNESPVGEQVVVNDRWGIDANCQHGDSKTCKDRYNPGKLVPFKWENAMTIDKKSWGYRKEANLGSYITTQKLIETLIETVSCGGNILMNIAPTADGRIIPIYEERLREIGKWMKINGDAIYDTRPWRIQKESSAWKIWYTKKEDRVFALMCRWPKSRYLNLPSPLLLDNTNVTLLGYNGDITWEKRDKGLRIDLQMIPAAALLNRNAWVFVLENVQ